MAKQKGGPSYKYLKLYNFKNKKGKIIKFLLIFNIYILFFHYYEIIIF